MKIKVSLGTAQSLGLVEKRIEAPVTAAHLLVGENCAFSCAFCPQGQAGEDSSGRFLSRISWPEFPMEEVVELLLKVYRDGQIDRACIQMVHGGRYREQVAEFFRLMQQKSCGSLEIPISVNGVIDSITQAQRLFTMGAGRLGLALDAASAELFSRYKGGSPEIWLQRLELLCELGKRYPARVSTHVIAGLGETEQQISTVTQILTNSRVTLGLFAFTPVRHTPLEDRAPPAMDSYRRIQLVHFGITQGVINLEQIQFDESGTIVSVPDKLLSSPRVLRGEPFETSGCPGCNRPYYNERPGQTPYNYPHALTGNQALQALLETNLTTSDKAASLVEREDN